MDIKHLLTQTFHQAMLAAGVEDPNPVIRQSQRPEFGHYQANGVMGAAKRMQTNPRALADLIVKHLPAQDHYTLEIAGPGFINITLTVFTAFGVKANKGFKRITHLEFFGREIQKV